MIDSVENLTKSTQEGSVVTVDATTKATTGTMVRILREVMIRHSKTQCLGGSVALALPASDACTVWLDMSPNEKILYDAAAQRSRDALVSVKGHSIHRSTLESKLNHARAACGQFYFEPKGKVTEVEIAAFDVLHSKTVHMKRKDFECIVYTPIASQCSKIQALLRDMADLKKQDRSMHCVVFTNSNESHDMLVAILTPLYQVCEFRGGTDCKVRDRAIRKFQEGITGGPATVFVVTMKAGAVGMTLTAATRCYLLQPCIDPAAEMQAAGRIHRLGQTKDVLVKRFAFRNSLDANIIALHAKIANGSVKIPDGFFTKTVQAMLL
jgi:SWI/SNF-related matrix-associated actin-dependent regulator of chromatin subfamily A3